ncbi:acyltransferase [Vibrio metschnikovii]|nr:acyltransferase [Vibrio metschnikovii]
MTIAEGAYIEFSENIIFRGLAYVGPYAYWSAKGGLKIGDNVIFGPKTCIWTSNHDYKSNLSIPYGGDDILKEVVIGDNVWVGLGSIILPGTIISEGVIISAGSVVRGFIPKGAIVSGNPAIVVAMRDLESYEKLKIEEKKYLYIKGLQ